MDFSINRFISFVIFFNAITGFGSAIRVVIEPEPYFTFLTDELKISCIADGPSYSVRSIVSIRMTKHDEDKTLALINMRQELKVPAGIKDNVKAQGQINKTSSSGHLTLTIDKPREDDAGIYRCQEFYVNENFQMVEGNAIGKVTYKAANMTDIVSDLVKKVSNLTTTVRAQDKTIQTKDELIATLKGVNSKQKQTIDNLTDTINRQNKGMEQLKMENAKQQKQLDSLIDFIGQLNKTKTEQTMKKKRGCPDGGWTLYKPDQTCVKVFGKGNPTKRLTWSRAREACQGYGGDLVQIYDKDKNAFVYGMLRGSGESFWIGIKDLTRDGLDFRYLDGTPLGKYHPWRYLNPDDDEAGDEKCVYMYLDGEWGDWDCDDPDPYVCSV